MNYSKLVNVRTMMAKDVGSVLDLEIKCQDYPRDLEGMKTFVFNTNRVGFVAKIGKKDVGYALCTTSKNKLIDKMVVIVGVLPSMRKMGISKKLMSEVIKRARLENCDSITFPVPSYKIDDPDDPDYVGWWFEALELKATKVLNNFYFRYGKEYDAYVFEGPV